MTFKKPPILSDDERERKAQEFIMNSPSNRSSSSIKLIVNGNLDRKKTEFKNKNLALHSAIEEEVNSCCRGNMTAVLNALIFIGLQTVKESKAIIEFRIPENIENELEKSY